MPLSTGTRIGPYEIVGLLGAGGMGEVYRARDTRLSRDVALKILCPKLAGDPGRRARFEREARTAGSLSHPNIVAVFDVGSEQETAYIVSELVDGETLRAVLGRGPVPVRRAVDIAVQIADGLAAAHAAGVVHRDVKPENVMFTRDGRVKLLDFGLARHLFDSARGEHESTLTEEGALWGTLGYMSPEQARGKPADHRSDIFSFGALFYEMLSGNRPFERESPVETLSAILTADPPPFDPLTAVPPAIESVVRHCMEKGPGERFQSAWDLAFALEAIAGHSVRTSSKNAALASQTPKRKTWTLAIAWASSLLLVAVLVALGFTRWQTAPAADVLRFAVYPPENSFFSPERNTTVPAPQFALSPDGRTLVFVAAPAGGKPLLWLRSLGELTARPLPGSENAEQPFWSPDGRWIGFLTDAKLNRISSAGGPVQAIADSFGDNRGASWGAEDTILMAPAAGPVHRLALAGGSPTPVTRLDAARQEGGHRWPQFLPDGRHFLFTVYSALAAQRGAYVAGVDGSPQKFVHRFNSYYADPGYLLWVDGQNLIGQPFDPRSLDLTGQPFSIAEKVGRSTRGNGAVSASRTGVLAYADVNIQIGQLTWFDRGGKALGTVGAEGDSIDFRLSPDEKRLALSLFDAQSGAPDVWLADFTRGGTSRLTFGSVLNASVLWSPDGSSILFRSNRKGVQEFYRKSTAGQVGEELVFSASQRADNLEALSLILSDWSPDGWQVLFAAPTTGSGFDLWLLPLTGDVKPSRFLSAPADQMHAVFSPDGKFVAYSSNESGRFEVYVQTFPQADRKWPVSTEGGYEPRWRGDGQEIYYLSEDRKLMSVAVGAGPSFSIPKPLFQTNVFAGVNALRTHYAPSADGRRFLVNTRKGEPAPTPITIVWNWTAALKH